MAITQRLITIIDQCSSTSQDSECPGGGRLIRASLFTRRLSDVSTSRRQAGTNNDEVTRGDNKLVISQQGPHQDQILTLSPRLLTELTHHPASADSGPGNLKRTDRGGGDKISQNIADNDVGVSVQWAVHCSTSVQQCVTGDRYRWLIPTSCPSPARGGKYLEITRPPPAATDNEYDGAIFIRSHMSITDVRPECQLQRERGPGNIFLAKLKTV